MKHANTARKSKRLSREQFRHRALESIQQQTGLTEFMAAPVVDAVLCVLDEMKAANGYVYIASEAREYDMALIRSALERGVSADDVCHVHGMSRATLNRMFPGGLPRPANLK